MPSKAHNSTGKARAMPSPALPTAANFTALRARLALAGYVLARVYSTSTGATTYYVSRWHLLRELNDLVAVADFLQQIGAK